MAKKKKSFLKTAKMTMPEKEMMMKKKQMGKKMMMTKAVNKMFPSLKKSK